MAEHTPMTMSLNNGLSMPAVGFGTFNKLVVNDRVMIDAVKTAIDVGFRHLDAAWYYNNETDVGQAIKEKIQDKTVTREELFITSKLWSNFMAPGRVEEAVRLSLEDLGVAYLDLYLVHWPTPTEDSPDDRTFSAPVHDHKIDYLDTWKAMEKLVEKGLVRSIGISNFNLSQVERLLNMDGLKITPSNHQIEIHPLLNNKDLVQYCQSKGISVTAYCPLGGMSGNVGIVNNPTLAAVGKKYGRSAAQVALRWGLQRGYAVLTKSMKAERIKHNFQLSDFELSDEDMDVVYSVNSDTRMVVPAMFKGHRFCPF
ncbi:1,5-anhydro-D-fructose reductase-like isoform X1 [Haliotis rufescens]|uniref:1,5-anhydro-D-fructose reductase-like isoform X1 n=1 Tax=Haliotis rufescens TaxID=6454 RepID=UPI00201F0244|nr:1,5-anhydro-D-fructose reductase-like isoform X1 [Haliotis rufescens]